MSLGDLLLALSRLLGRLLHWGATLFRRGVEGVRPVRYGLWLENRGAVPLVLQQIVDDEGGVLARGVQLAQGAGQCIALQAMGRVPRFLRVHAGGAERRVDITGAVHDDASTGGAGQAAARLVFDGAGNVRAHWTTLRSADA